MKSYLKVVLSLALTFAASAVFAGQDPSAEQPAPPRFGPFDALLIDNGVIQGVKVDDTDKIWILLNPQYRNEEIVLRISNDFKSGYRNWHHGEPNLISPAGQNKAPNEWTDWVRTSSNYIEYWIGDKLVLHLKRVS